VFVSHNRSFVNQLATKIWDVQAGAISEWAGNLDDYLHHLALIGQPMGGVPGSGGEKPTEAPAKVENDRERRQREAREREARGAQTRPLLAEIARLEARIATLETEQKELDPQLADPAIYADFARAQPLLDRHRANKDELERLYKAWEDAQERLARVSV